MAIRIVKEGVELDVNPGLTVEMKLTSPVYSPEGSQSISNTLPVSTQNNRLLNFPLRWENAGKVEEMSPVIIEDGSFQQSGELSIQGGNEKDGISFNIGFDESILYSKLKDTKLADLDIPPREFPGATIQEKIQAVVNQLEDYRGYENNEMTVFTVLLQNEKINDVPFQYFLNPVELKGNYANRQPLIWKARTETQVINGEKTYISVPDGYGVAPFLRVWRIVEFILDKLGLQIAENRIKTHPQLCMLCVPHNCADSICTGQIDYRYLMPDETVQGFLNSLFAKFGAVIFINSTQKSVKIKLLDEILASNEYWDITGKKASGYAWSRIASKQIKLKLNTGLQYASPNQENYNDFLKSYNYMITEIADVNDPANQFTVAYERPTGRYYRKNLVENAVITEYIGSDFFSWDAIQSLNDLEEITGTDESVPMIRSEKYGLVPAFCYPLRHVHTNLASNSIEEKEVKDSCKLAFVFYYGGETSGAHYENIELYYFASSFNISRDNTPILDGSLHPYSLSLTARSLFEHFWKRWDAILRHANQQYEMDVNLTKQDVFSLETHKKLMIDNHPFLMEELNFALGKQNLNNKLKVRSLALKKPYHLESEQQVPAFSSPRYKWVFENHYEETLAEIIEKTVIEDDGAGHSITYESTEIITGPSNENTQTLFPPTETDYTNNRTEMRFFDARAQFLERDPNNPDYTFYVDFQYPVIYTVEPV